jgi:DHA1 family multidrug resistance protein-like MFS transporter
MGTLFSFKENWQRNLVILWFGSFMTGVGLNSITPFMALFIKSMGNYSDAEVSMWSGLVFAANFIVLAFISPVWGRLADKYGRKPMLMRAALGMSIAIFIQSLVQSPLQLFLARMLQGFFAGFISNAVALMATNSPKEKSGQVLATLSTGGVSGQLLGPIIGSAVVELTGYRMSFMLTSAIMMCVFIMVTFLVHEDFTPVKETATKVKSGFKQVMASIDNRAVVMGMFISTMILFIANLSINPILSLYVEELLGPKGNVNMWSGVIAAAPGIITLIAAPILGRLGDRIGQKYILGGGLSLAFVILLAMAFSVNIWMLLVLRFMIGVADAAINPSIQAILTKSSPRDVTSRVFSYNQSFQAVGSITGSLVGSAVASAFGDYRYVFVATAIFVGFNILNFFHIQKKA